MARHKFLSLLLIASLTGGCSSKLAVEGSAPVASRATTSSPHAGAPADGPAGIGNGPLDRVRNTTRSRIVTVSIDMTSREVDRVARSLRAEVERLGGYVVNADSASGERPFAMMQLRVPGESLNAFRQATSHLAHIEHESENTEDVTEQRVDLEARLRNARAQETRVLQLMAERTGSLPDVMSAETELARVRESVERLDAELTTLSGRIDYATINVRVGAPGTEFTDEPGDSLASAASDGLQAAWMFLLGSLMVLLAVAPTFLLLAVPAFFLVRTLMRRRRRRAATSVANPPVAPTLA